jgi:hypothetical protein
VRSRSRTSWPCKARAIAYARRARFKEYLAALEAKAEANPDRKPPKVISPSDPCSAWTAKANKRVQFGYGLNYLIVRSRLQLLQGSIDETIKAMKQRAER